MRCVEGLFTSFKKFAYLFNGKILTGISALHALYKHSCSTANSVSSYNVGFPESVTEEEQEGGSLQGQSIGIDQALAARRRCSVHDRQHAVLPERKRREA